MSDVATTCISGNTQVAGRAITRMPGTRTFRVDPKINHQMTSEQMREKYDDRLDNRAYYYDIASQ